MFQRSTNRCKRAEQEFGEAFAVASEAKVARSCGCAASVLGTTLLITLGGCANPGPPKPPSLHLPQIATQVTASRSGNRVTVRWKTEGGTTDGGTLRGGITSVLCREVVATEARAGKPAEARTVPDCTHPVHRAGVVPGASVAFDDLSGGVAAGKPSLLAYRVELLNDRGRSAGLSAPAYAAAGAAPPAAGALAIALRRNGLLVTWRAEPGAGDAPMHLSRTLVATAGQAVIPKLKPKKAESQPVLAKKSDETAAELTLIPEIASPDPGGTIDRTLHDGDSVTYIAQRVQTVELSAPASAVIDRKGKIKSIPPANQSLEISGEPSPPATFTFHDTLPPTAPTGLVGIAGGGFGQPRSIDLSWEANPENDVTGYNVYRAEADGDHWTKMNAEQISGPAYRDLTAEPGRDYRYRVTAVDPRHHESAPSAVEKERLDP